MKLKGEIGLWHVWGVFGIFAGFIAMLGVLATGIIDIFTLVAFIPIIITLTKLFVNVLPRPSKRNNPTSKRDPMLEWYRELRAEGKSPKQALEFLKELEEKGIVKKGG